MFIELTLIPFEGGGVLMARGVLILYPNYVLAGAVLHQIGLILLNWIDFLFIELNLMGEFGGEGVLKKFFIWVKNKFKQAGFAEPHSSSTIGWVWVWLGLGWVGVGGGVSKS